MACIRPIPTPDQDSLHYWQGCKQHKLIVPKCLECGSMVFPSRIICPECFSGELAEVELSGLGTVYTFTVVYKGPSPAFQVPYVVALVELDEGIRMLSNIMETELDRIKIGMRVRCVFEDINDELTLPVFTELEEGLV